MKSSQQYLSQALRFFILCCFCTFPSILAAQQDTNLVSLTVGNRFYFFIGEYSGADNNNGVDPRMNTYYTEVVLKDTTISTNTFAVVYNSFLKQQRYERADRNNLYGWNNGIEFRKISFDIQRNDTVKSLATSSYFLGIPLVFDNYTFLFKGIQSYAPSKSFTGVDSSIHILSTKDKEVVARFSKRFGLTQSAYSARNGARYGIFLHAARIDGQLYGDTLFGLRTGITDNDPLPNALATPNPFSEQMQYSFQTYAPASVSVAVVSTSGQIIRSLPAQALASGKHAYTWDGKDNEGKTAPAGAYIVQVYANDKPLATAKVVKQ